jgi:hypothetical protein
MYRTGAVGGGGNDAGFRGLVPQPRRPAGERIKQRGVAVDPTSSESVLLYLSLAFKLRAD